MRRPGRTLARILGLITLTALGVCLTLGAIAVAVLLVASNLAG